jgi:Xaa-Pro dipeptidase
VKDEEEMRSIERAASITNDLLGALETLLTDSTELSEVDVALFLEREALRRGCEGMSFESLVAGPSRSFGIHAFPPYSAAPFSGPGMSILDFGVLVGGYPSDVTVTVVRGRVGRKQEEMIELVQEAYEQAAARAKPDVETREIAKTVDEIFARHGYRMPHSLGHGLGLEVHEKPYLRDKPGNETRLQSGMVFTIEPGLYDPEAGGVRLENDFLVTSEGTKVLTTSRILRLP